MEAKFFSEDEYWETEKIEEAPAPYVESITKNINELRCSFNCEYQIIVKPTIGENPSYDKGYCSFDNLNVFNEAYRVIEGLDCCKKKCRSAKDIQTVIDKL
ncbi:hypothetical protein EIN_492410 [Entamoeba invadens IP1]|uniref:Uncharacterized protein n=1 Tax=Entamoeba invadens IP1 TaxID=370355 RepID=A0A0A1U438_ENTIV|nr:hypothetical protein EIN_492410 [Entamoeba invadens IP1]ELP88992.1 hypothetical protein EIN_492410 [Entamoeba invadens IP1]|eukprot:XP_004255763.1 hypothetical protein EIN_492410 [Entamoeba invadens IP1]